MEVQVEVVFKNLQVEAAVQIVGKSLGGDWIVADCQNLQAEVAVQIDGFGYRRRLGLQLSFRICRWRRWCRLMALATGGG